MPYSDFVFIAFYSSSIKTKQNKTKQVKKKEAICYTQTHIPNSLPVLSDHHLNSRTADNNYFPVQHHRHLFCYYYQYVYFFSISYVWLVLVIRSIHFNIKTLLNWICTQATYNYNSIFSIERQRKRTKPQHHRSHHLQPYARYRR